ncbi:MAG: RNA polymerase sigma factor [Planctomycetota bacterium]
MVPAPNEETPEAPAGEGRRATDSENSVNAPDCGGYGGVQMQCEATQLMTAARMGSADAFETLFLKVRGSAFQAARSLVGSHEDALDLTQEAFIKAYRARETYDPSQPFLPWFHRILRNTCFSFLRTKGRLAKRSIHGLDADGEDATWDVVDEDAPAPSAQIEASERAEAFETALARLSARDREIIVLRHYQEMAYRDIAAALSIPEGTVMSRLYHARKRLRSLLEHQVEDLVGPGEAAARAKVAEKRKGGRR